MMFRQGLRRYASVAASFIFQFSSSSSRNAAFALDSGRCSTTCFCYHFPRRSLDSRSYYYSSSNTVSTRPLPSSMISTQRLCYNQQNYTKLFASQTKQEFSISSSSSDDKNDTNDKPVEDDDHSTTSTKTTDTTTDSETSETISTNIDNDNDNIMTKSTWRKRLQRRVGVVMSTIGFTVSTVQSLRISNIKQEFQPTVDALTEFLQESGIDLELTDVLVNRKLLDNVIILSRIERAALSNNDRRDFAVVHEPLFGQPKIPSHEEALRYMKYCTAVYGEAMIRAAEMDVLGKFDDRLLPLSRSRISEHCNIIPEQNIILMDIEYDGPSNHLRHFVAVDHTNQKVVLAIRGTFNLSEVMVDIAGFSRPFCGGEAHSEMATMAERIWDVAGPTVLILLEENPEYEFIITGHSLGAGAACLLNILCHENDRELVKGKNVRCFAYASPPVFTPLDIVPDAVKACTNYIHERDTVPFLSVDAIRHLCNCIKAVDSMGLSWRQRVKIITGYEAPSDEMIEAVRIANDNRLTPKPGAPLLTIPAESNVWMSENKMTGMYNIKICDSNALAKLGIFVDLKMFDDHYPSRYEHAFHNLDS